MAELRGMGDLQWTGIFHLSERSGAYLNIFLLGPFGTPMELAVWRSKFLKRFRLLCPSLSPNITLRLIFQEIRDYSFRKGMERPGDPEKAAEEFIQEYVGGHA